MCHVSLHFAVLNVARSETAPESIGLMQACGQSALPCSREELRAISDLSWIFRIWLPDGSVRVLRWIDGILNWRWIRLGWGAQVVAESRIFIGIHGSLMLAKRQRQPLISDIRHQEIGRASCRERV